MLVGIFGRNAPPPGVAQYNAEASANTGGASSIGLIIFLSNVISVVYIVAGIFTMFNFLRAAFDFITARGNTAAYGKVKDRLTMSVIGIAIIVSSYTIISIIGYIFFGQANFILSPTLVGPSTLGATP